MDKVKLANLSIDPISKIGLFDFNKSTKISPRGQFDDSNKPLIILAMLAYNGLAFIGM